MGDNGDTTDKVRLSLSLFECMLAGESEGAMAIITEWASVHGFHSAIVDLLEPALTEVGKRWEKEQISLAAGYLAGKIAEDTLTLAAAHSEPVSGDKGIAVIGNIEDDYHSLGRRLVGVFLRTAGWIVIDLGNDVVPEAFVDAAVRNRADVIGVSSMMLSTAKKIFGVRQELDDRGLTDRIKLAVGGAVFKIHPELVKEVGGDGTASNAVDVPALFQRLKEDSRHDVP